MVFLSPVMIERTKQGGEMGEGMNHLAKEGTSAECSGSKYTGPPPVHTPHHWHQSQN